MPKFKYVPNKDNNKEEINIKNQDETPSISPENKISSNVPKVERPIQPTPTPFKPIQMPQPQPKPYNSNPIPQRQITESKPMESVSQQKPVQKETEDEIDLIVNFNKKKEVEETTEKNEFVNEAPVENKPKNKKKINIKWILVLVVIAVAISMIFGVSQTFQKENYSITAQDLMATSVQNIEEGALMDIQNNVPLSLSIRDFNISTPKTESNTIVISLWDFTNTNQNKVSISVDGNVVENGLTITKDPFHLEVPATSKVEIMQVETVNSPYTPYALQVNGTTYFNRLSAEKLNNYQFLVMDEIQNLTVEDFTSKE